MKMDKLDSKQVPQVIVLGVLAVGALGFGVWKLTSGSTSAPAQAATPAPAQAQTTTSVTIEDGKAGVKPKPQMAKAAVMPGVGLLPPVSNPDPFKAKGVPTDGGSTSPRPVPPPPVETGPRWPQGAGSLPSLDPTGPVTPAVPQGPQRPDVTVVGVSDAMGGRDLAFLAFNGDQRLVTVGETVGDYRLKRVAIDGVWLAHGRDNYFVGVQPVGPRTTK